jgi:excisionase family DNA binding protein
VREAASVLGVSPRTVWRLIARRDLDVVRIGARVLIRDSDLRAFVSFPDRPARVFYVMPESLLQPDGYACEECSKAQGAPVVHALSSRTYDDYEDRPQVVVECPRKGLFALCLVDG